MGDRLEDYLRAELQATPADTVGDDVAGEGIAAVIVEGRRAELVDAVCGIGSKAYILRWDSQPLVVEEIEGIGLELHSQAFGQPQVFIDAGVDCVDGLPAFRVAAHTQEGRTEVRCRDRIVDDPVSLVQCDRCTSVDARQTAVRSGGAVA